MSNLYQMFEMDADLEREGITVNYGSVKVLLARAGGRNAGFKRLFNAKVKSFRHQIKQETLDDEVAERLMAEAYAEKVILGWWSRKEDENGDPILNSKGEEKWDDVIENAEGKRVKFSVDACVQILLDLPELFINIQEMSTSAANYRKELEAEDEENLEQS